MSTSFASRAAQLAGETILDVRDLEVAVGPQRNPRLVVRGVSLQIQSGEIYGLLGESGSGKSMTVQAINGLLPAGARVAGGSVKFRGEELIGMGRRGLAQIRGARIGMVFQDSLTSLNPIMSIGAQVAEPLRLHRKASRREAKALVCQRLSAMGMADAEHVVGRYPHEFSGGMRQRATIATALINHPELLIADEPTTALDVTVQAQILDICRRLNEELGVAILLISHDLGVLSEICTTIGVMYAGRIVQTGPTRALLERPNHPYTRALVESMPRSASPRGTQLKAIAGEPPSPEALPEGCKFNPRCAFAIARCRIEEPVLTPVGETRSACWVAESGLLPPMPETVALDEARYGLEPARRQTREVLLTASGLRRYFAAPSDRLFGRSRHVHAVESVSLELRRGETLGIVGESGCGKSTLARCLLRLTDLDAGQIVFMGRDITTLAGDELRRVRREMQPIFQDPYASLNPRQRIADIVAEPLAVNDFPAEETASRVKEALDLVGLGHGLADRFPYQLSGGQQQRVGIARAIVLRPALIVADEPISSLDLSIQAQIINLLHDLQQRFDLTLVFISHDLRVVRQICSKIAVMFLGQIVENGPSEEVCAEPRHPYTRALLASVPELSFARDRRRGALISGDPPSPISPPSGCRFRTRCAFAKAKCADAEPVLTGIDADHVFACHYPLPVGDAAIARAVG
jgi:peptide/nickel transport system ATP-binding protein